MIVTRKILHLEEYITIGHIESMNKVIVVTGTIVGVAYLTELFIAWYSGYVYEQFAFFNRAFGPYWWSYFGMMFCNVISPQIFWSRKMRRNITVTPTWVEIGIFIGTMGLFSTLYLIFCRVAPVVAVAEVKSILKTAGDQYTGPAATHHGHNHMHGGGVHGIIEGVDYHAMDGHGDHGHGGGHGHGGHVEHVDHGAYTDHGDAHHMEAQAETDTKTLEYKIPDYGGLKDDLTKLEGVGPKTERALNSVGINSFAALSEMDGKYE